MRTICQIVTLLNLIAHIVPLILDTRSNLIGICFKHTQTLVNILLAVTIECLQNGGRAILVNDISQTEIIVAFYIQTKGLQNSIDLPNLLKNARRENTHTSPLTDSNTAQYVVTRTVHTSFVIIRCVNRLLYHLFFCFFYMNYQCNN